MEIRHLILAILDASIIILAVSIIVVSVLLLFEATLTVSPAHVEKTTVSSLYER